MFIKLLFLLFFVSRVTFASIQKLDTVYKWKYIDFKWESPEQKEEAIKNGDYDFKRVIPMDSKKDNDGRVFLSIVRRDGNPVRLGTVTKEMGPSGPLIAPYPDWSWYTKENCDSINNNYRLEIDECNRLWVLDLGVSEPHLKCDAQLLSFDLNTDKLIERAKIPKDISHSKEGISLLTNVVVETDKDHCESPTVYMADTFGFAVIVYDNNKLKRLENPYFEPVENATKTTVGSVSVNWQDDGILGMAISPKKSANEPRYLYFKSLSSHSIYYVSTDDLKKSKNGENLKVSGEKEILSSHAIGIRFSSDGVLFFSPIKEATVECWNRYTELTRDNIEIVAQDPEQIVYMNQMQIVPATADHPEEEFWGLVNRLPYFSVGKVDFNDYNFKILAAPVKKLIAGTKCSM